MIAAKHFRLMKDGPIVCNSGHFNVELELDGLDGIAVRKRKVREYVQEYTLKSGKRINVLGEGHELCQSGACGSASEAECSPV